MSLSLGIDSIMMVIKSCYDPNLPTHYDEEHLRVLRNAISLFTGMRRYNYIETRALIQEPIMFICEAVWFSIPLIAQLVNAPILIDTRIKTIEGSFNPFNGLSCRLKGEELYSREIDDGIVEIDFTSRKRKTPKKNNKPVVYDTSSSESEFSGSDNDESCDDDDNYIDKFNEIVKSTNIETNTRLIQIIRLVMAAHHFAQHKQLNNWTMSHKDFIYELSEKKRC